MQKHRGAGFTLIELMLAMSFVAMLLLAIAMILIHSGNLYNRGLTLKAINQAGRDITDTLRRDFLQANAGKVSRQVADEKQAVIWARAGGEVRSGRFCLGDYSYVWNVPKVIAGEVTGGPGVIVESGGVRAGRPVNFARVIDPDGALCKVHPVTGKLPDTIDHTSLSHLLKPAQAGDVILAVHSLGVKLLAHDGVSSGLFAVNITLGTSQLESIDTANGSCKPPADGQANIDFCAINNFDMIMRTNG